MSLFDGQGVQQLFLPPGDAVVPTAQQSSLCTFFSRGERPLCELNSPCSPPGGEEPGQPQGPGQFGQVRHGGGFAIEVLNPSNNYLFAR